MYWFKGMKLENAVIRPFRDFVGDKHALPPGRIRGIFSSHWRFLFSEVLEEGLKARGMESELPPTATPEQLKGYFENCKIVLEDKVSYFYDGGKGLGNAVLTWASKCSWGEINEHGTPSDKEKNGPQGK